MKKSRTKDSERLLINNAIKNLDYELYSHLSSPGFNLSDDEVKTAILLKCGYSLDDICIYTGINEDQIRIMIRSIITKTGKKNIKQLKNLSINKKRRSSKMKLKILFLLAGILFAAELHSQFVVQWAARFDGLSNEDKSNDMYVDAAGNVYVTGMANDSGNGTDYITIKYNTGGVVQWIASYSGQGNHDQAFAIFVDGLGNVYVTGESRQSTSNRDIATVKYNSNGVQQWASRYNGPFNNEDIGEAIIVDSQGNVYVAGQTAATGGSDYVIIMYNSAGVEQYAKRYSGTANNSDIPHDIALSPSQSALYITGESPGTGTNFDYLTLKVNAASGDTLWSKRFNTGVNRQDKAFDLVVDNIGNIIVTGFSDSISTMANDYLTVKYDSNGTRLWQRRFNGSPVSGNNSDIAYAITTDQQNNIYITGESVSTTPTIDIVTIKYNSAGDSLWSARYNGLGNGDDRGYSITLDNSGNVYVTGESMSVLPVNTDYIAIKYNSSGIEQFVARYDGPVNSQDISKVIKVDAQGNIYVTGESTSVNLLDMTTVKFGPANGISSISNEIPAGFKLSQNYPNPFNPVTNIIFAVPRSSAVKLTVYNALGAAIETLAERHFNAGIYRADWDASKYSSGIYFYRIESEGFSETKKMILVK